MEAFLMAQGDPPEIKSAGMGIVLSLGLLWWRDDSIFGLPEERRDTHFLFGYWRMGPIVSFFFLPPPFISFRPRPAPPQASSSGRPRTLGLGRSRSSPGRTRPSSSHPLPVSLPHAPHTSVDGARPRDVYGRRFFEGAWIWRDSGMVLSLRDSDSLTTHLNMDIPFEPTTTLGWDRQITPLNLPLP